MQATILNQNWVVGGWAVWNYWNGKMFPVNMVSGDLMVSVRPVTKKLLVWIPELTKVKKSVVVPFGKAFCFLVTFIKPIEPYSLPHCILAQILTYDEFSTCASIWSLLRWHTEMWVPGQKSLKNHCPMDYSTCHTYFLVPTTVDSALPTPSPQSQTPSFIITVIHVTIIKQRIW